MHYAFVGIASAPYLKSFWFAVMVGRRRIVDALRKETAYYWKRPYGRTQPWPSRIGDWEAVSGKIINTMWIRRSVSSVHDALELEEKLSHTLLPRQIGMVHMRLEGMTLKEIGAHFGISESRTCQVFSEINRRLQ
jgi:DNA-directed RNA polymerase specialized sigma24 family protein